MMKKEYSELEIEICNFFAEDIITSSGPFAEDIEGGDTELPPVWYP